MALRLLQPTEMVRQMGNMVWIEDLEKRGHSYGDLLAFLEGIHVPCVCSPIHDRDTYTADDVRGWCKRHIDPDTGEVAEGDLPRQPRVGEPKKPHVHVYYNFKGKRKPRDVARLWEDFVPEVTEKRFVDVPDFGAMLRYCAHMDAPKKAQYDPMAIHGFANVCMAALWDERNFNKLEVLGEIDRYIEGHKIENVYRLVKWAFSTGDVAVISTVTGRYGFYAAIFAAKRQERIDRAERKKARAMARETSGEELIG